MNISVISGSMRSQSQSRKVAEYLVRRIQHFSHNGWVVDLHEISLPMFDDGPYVSQNAVEIRRHLNDSDGTIFVSPEWNGMMSHGILNMLHYIKDELEHKPVMLVGVSSGRGGAYPIEQMRQIGPKNRHYVISPENLIVSDVTRMLNDDQFSSENIDYQVKIRADYALQILFVYAHALAQVRTSDVIDLTSFSSGV